MMIDQDRLPLWEALQQYCRNSPVRMHMPGHKGGSGFPEPLRSAWGSLAGFDVTELAESDDLAAPWGPLVESQRLLADLYGAKESFYLVNGASVGLMAALLALLPEGEGQRKVMLPRQAHRALWQGCVLADLWPISAVIEVDTATSLPLPPSTAAVAELLEAHPDVQAAVLLQPSYHGLIGDTQAQIALLKEREITVIVDEAHGTHLRFLPRAVPDALSSGADVVVQSPHKTAGSLTQTAWMHCQGGRVSADRLRAALNLLHSSSPSFPLLLSLEAARRQLALDGERLWADVCSRDAALRLRIVQSTKLSALCQGDLPSVVRYLDPGKLYLLTRACGFSGYRAAQILRSAGISSEMADASGVLWLHSPADSAADCLRLVDALDVLAAQAEPALPALGTIQTAFIPQRVCSPRLAWQAERCSLPLLQAAGHIAAEMITPYPPGVPLVTPGELFSPELVEYLVTLLSLGARITGIAPETETVEVVRI